MRDPLVHGRKTIAGLDLSFGRTTTTPCEKTRKREVTSTDPAEVTCPQCRQWFAAQEHIHAGMALAAADISAGYGFRSLTGDGITHDRATFQKLAVEHENRAARWEEAP